MYGCVFQRDEYIMDFLRVRISKPPRVRNSLMKPFMGSARSGEGGGCRGERGIVIYSVFG